MKINLRIPQFAASTVETPSKKFRPVLDGSEVVVPNRWNLPAHTVAMVGRRAVWFGIDLLKWHWEQDFGGHLFLVVVGADATQATIVEAGPMHPNGTGALVPFRYPEDDFAEHKITDFEPEIIPPPHGLSAEFFGELVRTTHRTYDGDQRYLAVEIPFLRVGRDSNSYAIGVLLCCCVDPRAISKGPKKAIHPSLISRIICGTTERSSQQSPIMQMTASSPTIEKEYFKAFNAPFPKVPVVYRSNNAQRYLVANTTMPQDDPTWENVLLWTGLSRQQQDGHNCGIFTIYNTIYLMKDLMLNMIYQYPDTRPPSTSVAQANYARVTIFEELAARCEVGTGPYPECLGHFHECCSYAT